MVTNGGIYILQLVDNHSATYSALILGCLEVSVMAWIYGVDRFLDDLRFMLGFYPYPRILWKAAWMFISPTIVVVSAADRETIPNSSSFLSADPGVQLDQLQRQLVRWLHLPRVGERARLVHHLLLGGLRPHRRHLEDLPRGRKPRLPRPEAYAAQRGLGTCLLAAPAG